MTQFAKDVSELMSHFDNAKRKWIELNGTEEGFEEFFIDKVLEEGRKRRDAGS